jgi:hypothetical protein
MFGSPLQQANHITTRHIPQYNIEYIKPFSAEIYKAYHSYFQDKTSDNNISGAQKDLPDWYHSNWFIYDVEDPIIDRLDFHGLNRAETQYWLEYMKYNAQRFSKKINIITGRGNHSRQTFTKDISTKMTTGNDSTGILEDFVFRWLKQNHYRYIKHPGNFDVYT